MINGVSFGNDINALMAAQPSNATSPQETIGAYSMYDDEGDKAEFSHGHPVIKTVGTLAVIAAALGLARGKMAAIKEIDLGKTLKDTEGFMGKVKWLIAKGGEGVIKGLKHTKALFSKSAKLELKKEEMTVIEKKIEEAQAAVKKAAEEVKAAGSDQTKKGIAAKTQETAEKTLTDLQEKQKALQTKIDELSSTAKTDTKKDADKETKTEAEAKTEEPAPEAK